MPQRDTQELLSIWNTHEQRSTWREVTRRGGNNEIAQRVLDELPEVSAIEALAANRELVELLIARRWYVIRDAREAGQLVGDRRGPRYVQAGRAGLVPPPHRRARKNVADFHDAERAQQALRDS